MTNNMYNDNTGITPKPYDKDLEMAVLGALLIQNEAIFDVIDIIDENSFYIPAHQDIYRAIRKLSYKGTAIDIMTVAHHLKSRDKLDSIGGELYLAELTDRLASAAHIEFHAKIVQQKKVQRDLIDFGIKVKQMSEDKSAELDNLLAFAESELFKITDVTIKQEVVHVSSAIEDCLNDLEKRAQSKSDILGLPTGFNKIDRTMGPFQPSDLVIVAARPSMGKTAYALSLLRNMSLLFKKKGAMFSLEMATKQLMNRLVIAEAEINSMRFKNGKLKDDEWIRAERVGSQYENAPIYFDDTPMISIFELRSKCRKLKRTEGLDYIIIDYLQLMSGGKDFKGNSREAEISFISRSLKGLAKELNIPVIALSQLNRSVENRGGDKRPQLSDIRESGAIEQDADVVIFLHRPEYYGITVDTEGNSLIGLAEIIYAKFRNGKTGSVLLRWMHQFMKFTDRQEDIPNSKTQKETLKFETHNDVKPNEEFEEDDSPF